MPIRTNRGRAAVYRRLWGWPLRSPNHLIAAIVGFAALVTTISIAIPNAVKPGTRAASSSTRVTPSGGGNQIGVLPTTGTTTPLPTKAPSPTAAATSVAVDPNAQLVAENWVMAWEAFKPGTTTKEKWLAGLKPFTSVELFPQLESIEPANVPVVIDNKVKATKSVTGSVEFEAPLENGKLVLTVAKLPEGWRVHKFDKVG